MGILKPDQVKRLLLAGSSYKQLQRVTCRFCQQSGYKPDANFNRANSGKRPEAEVQIEIRGRIQYLPVWLVWKDKGVSYPAYCTKDSGFRV